MPRGNQPQSKHQLARVLVIGDGKCGKTDWAARAVEGGFNVLYMDADVGSQTIAGLTKDRTDPVKPELMEQIFIMNVGDIMIDGGLDYRFVKMFKRFTVASPTFRWNDTQSREWSIMADGDETSDEIWEIKPAYMDHTCVLVIDSWTAIAQSAMNWASDALGIDIGEISEEDRRTMRAVYQAAGEKLTQYLTMIRSMPCHVIVIGHPREFVKTEKQPGKSVSQKESDMKVLWTKMVLASSSNNHAFSMGKYFTDIAWIEVDSVGEFMIDYRADGNKLSGSHFQARLSTRDGGRFIDLLQHIGATIPGGPQPFDHWLTIHQDGFKAPDGKKPNLILGAQKSPGDGAPASVTGIKPVTLNLGPKKVSQ